MKNETALRVLFVDDSQEDVEFAARELKQAGVNFSLKREDTEAGFLKALTEFAPDFIITDCSTANLEGTKALQLARRWNRDIPFIILTEPKNEEAALFCLKEGASDYVHTDHIRRLPHIVLRVLEHARVAAEKEAAARAWRESEENYRTLADSGQALIWTADLDKNCVYFNKPWMEFTGRTLEQESGDGWTRSVHPDDLERCVAIYSSAFDRREKFSLEYRLKRYDGEYRWIQDDGCPRYGTTGDFLGYLGHCLDITERKLAEKRTIQALEEKEILLRELFHRTRNNMQVIMAILAFEDDAAHNHLVSEVIRKTSDRIMAMSLVHKKLYESQNLFQIDLKEYIQELLESLMGEESFPSERIRVETHAESVPVHIDIAIPCGLVLHELISNAFYHAFPGKNQGEVRVSLARSVKGCIEIEVSDDGIGLPDGFNYQRKDTLGFQLILGLAEQQLNGKMWFETKRGLSCHVTFEDSKAIKRV